MYVCWMCLCDARVKEGKKCPKPIKNGIITAVVLGKRENLNSRGKWGGGGVGGGGHKIETIL